MIRLFSDRSHYRKEHRGHLAEILKPYFKDNPFGDEQRKQLYSLAPEDFCLADNLAQADIAVLPMTWNHYLERREVGLALSFIQAARGAGRPVLSYVTGDEGVTVPLRNEDVWVVRASGFHSRRRKRQFAQPVFTDDPWKRYPDLQSYARPKEAGGQPLVGFCGQASQGMFKLGVDVVRGCVRNIKYSLGMRLEEPQPVYPPSLIRARAMQTLAASPLVKARFIIRERYRGGATDAAAREQTTREFYQNMAESDYTLSVRGGGNFSKRFYETLAMGRIPVLIDTDCFLPLEDQLPWNEYIVRVPSHELKSLPARLAEHFASKGVAGLEEQKKKCRRLWSEGLSFGEFHRRIARSILETP